MPLTAQRTPTDGALPLNTSENGGIEGVAW
jgi:hypothetical protein